MKPKNLFFLLSISAICLLAPLSGVTLARSREMLSPSPSSSAGKICFQSDRDGNFEIYA